MKKTIGMILVLALLGNVIIAPVAEAKSRAPQATLAAANQLSDSLVNGVVSSLLGESLGTAVAMGERGTAEGDGQSLLAVTGAAAILAGGSAPYAGNTKIKVDLQALLAANQNPLDSDGDGLPDAVEGVLGTSLDSADSDFDGLNDRYEVEQGLDPINPDSNNDGINDYVEIVNSDGSLDPAKDTDGDGTPDVWDDDNDGDGVRDELDLSPFTSTGSADAFKFSITSRSEDGFLDVQVRPANPEYLWLSGQTWDWPDDDKGLMQDVDGSTDDLTLTPMLELTRTGGRPMPTQEQVSAYGIMVKDENTVLVPLSTVADGGKNIAFGGRMFFPDGLPQQTELSAKLAWTVKGKKEGIADPSTSELTSVNAFSWDTQGAGIAIGDLDGNGRQDLLLMVVDAPGTENTFRYLVGWDLDPSGAPSSYSQFHDASAAGWDNRGGDVALCNLDNDKEDTLEAVVMGIEHLDDGTNRFRYRVGRYLDQSGEFGAWSRYQVSPELPADSSAGGLAIHDLDGNGKPELIMMAVNDVSGENSLTFCIGWDLDVSGGVSLSKGYTQFTIPRVFGDATQGAGLAIMNLDGDSRPEYVIAVVDDPQGANHYEYVIGWDTRGWDEENAENCGRPQSFTQRNTVSGDLPAEAAGGGLAVGNVDADGRPDLAFLSIDRVHNSANQPRITWARNVGYTTGNDALTVSQLSASSKLPVFPGLGANDTASDIADINGDGKPDLLLAALYRPGDGVNADYVEYSYGFGLNADGNVHGRTPPRRWVLDPHAERGNFTVGARLYDVDGDGDLDLLLSGVLAPETDDDDVGSTATLTWQSWYKVGWNVDANGNPDDWSQTVLAPVNQIAWERTIGTESLTPVAGGIAIADINRNGIPDLLLMQAKDNTDAQGRKLYGYHFDIGWDIDPASGAVESWGSQSYVCDLHGARGGDVLLDDLNGNGRADLLVMSTLYYNEVFQYRVGWDLADDGAISDWTEPFTIAASNESNQLGETYGGGLALWDLPDSGDDEGNGEGNGIKDLVISGMIDNGQNSLHQYKLAWDVSSNPNVMLSKYYTPCSLTGFKFEEYSGSDAAVFYSTNQDETANRDETTKAYVDLRYDFLQSDHPLAEADEYLDQADIQVSHQIESFANSDAAVSAINDDLLSDALDELDALEGLPDNSKLPVIIALETRFADKNMDEWGSVNGSLTSFTINTRQIDVATVKSLRMGWFDADEHELVDPEELRSIAQSLEHQFDNDINEILKLLLVWDVGEARLTEVGETQIIQDIFGEEKEAAMQSLGEATYVLAKVQQYANGMGQLLGRSVPAIKGAYQVCSIIKGARVAQTEATAATSGGAGGAQTVSRTRFAGLSSKAASFAKGLQFAGAAVALGCSAYAFYQIASTGSWSSESIMMGAIYFSLNMAYTMLLSFIGMLPGGAVLTALVLLSDLITEWVGGEGWSSQAISWIMDSLMSEDEIEPRSEATVVITESRFEPHDLDDNGMTVGDTIGLTNKFDILIEGIVDDYVRPSVRFAGSDDYDQNWSVNESAPQYYLRGGAQVAKRNIYTATAQLTWGRAGVNIPVTIEFESEYQVTMSNEEKVQDSNSNQSTLYFDVTPGSLEDFLNWSVLAGRANDPDGDGLPTRDSVSEWKPDGSDIHTLPYDWDTDDDGLSDSFEAEWGSEPHDGDSDNDGLSDREEYRLGTDPNKRDTDGDGLDDGSEVLYYRSWTVQLFDEEVSFSFRSDPTIADTDGDEIRDDYEVTVGGENIRTNACSADTDGDGTLDSEDSDPLTYAAALAGTGAAAAFEQGEARYLKSEPWMNDAPSWTFAAWVKPDDPLQGGVIWSEGSPDKQLGSISLGADGGITVRMGKLQPNEQPLTRAYTTPAGVLQAGEWQLLLVRFQVTDDVANTGQVVVEVDGVRHASQPTLFMQQNANDTVGVLGMDSTRLNHPDYPANEFSGLMDEVYWWHGVPANTDYRYLLANSRSYPYDQFAGHVQAHWWFDNLTTADASTLRLVRSEAPQLESTPVNQAVTFELPHVFYGQTTDSVKVEVTKHPVHGSLGNIVYGYGQHGPDGVNGPWARCTYTPDADYVGSDGFQYKLTGNGHEYSREAEVELNIYSVPVIGLLLRYCPEQGQGDERQGTEISLTLEDLAVVHADVQPTGASNTNVTWTVDDPELLSISPGHTETNTWATLEAGSKTGETTLTATTADGGFEATAQVTVLPKQMLQFGQEAISLPAGQSRTFLHVATPTPGSSEDPTICVRPEDAELNWLSTDSSIVSVDEETGTITANQVGTAYIYADPTSGHNCRVTVLPITSGLELSEQSTTITAGGSEEITATVLPEDGPDTGVICASDNTEVATVEIDRREGNVSVLKITAHKVGFAEITVTTKDHAFEKTIAVTVVAVPTVRLNKSNLSLMVGKSETLEAKIGLVPADVIWLSSNPAIATVDENGKVTAVGVDRDSIDGTSGTAYITAVQPNGAVSLPCTVRTTTCVDYTLRMPFDDADEDLVLDFGANRTATVSATMYLATPLTEEEIGSVTKTDIWSSDGTAQVSIESTDKQYIWEDGLVTAVRYFAEVTAQGTGSGTIGVRAPDNSCYGSGRHLTVYPFTTGITLDQTELSLAYGTTASLTATVQFMPNAPDGAPEDAIWSSADPTTASVDQNGVITAKRVGTTTITAATPDRAHSANCTVAVTPSYTGISLNQTELELWVGQSEELTAAIEPAEEPAAGAVWSSDNPTIASVSPSGKVTAVRAGSTNIVAASPDGAVSAICTVTVLTHPQLVYLDQYSVDLSVGDSMLLRAYVIPEEEVADRRVFWNSSAAEVATVDAYGNVTAVSAGAATITVTTEDGGLQFLCRVTVTGSGTVTTEPLATPDQPTLERGVVSWTAVVNENAGYSLQLYKDGEQFGDLISVDHDAEQGTLCDPVGGELTRKTRSLDLLLLMTEGGHYTVTVTAKGVGLFSDSPDSVQSQPQAVSGQFPQPEQPTLSDGVATWTAAAEDAAYQIRLYRDGWPCASFAAEPGSTSHDFTASMNEAGYYTVTVARQGTGIYSTSPESPPSDPQTVIKPLAKPQKPVLTTAHSVAWAAVPNENAGYALRLYRDGDALEDDPVVIDHGEALYYDCSQWMTAPGVYTVTVTAKGSGLYLDSPQSDYSNGVTVSVALQQPAAPQLTDGIADWEPVANENNGYRVQLYRDNLLTGAEAEIPHGDALSYDFSAAMTDPGTYTVTVIARGAGAYLDSPESDPSNQQTVGETAPAVISGITPASLEEASANDGSLASGEVTLTIANGALSAGIGREHVSTWNLPAGLDFQVSRVNDVTLAINITGRATRHAETNSVSNLFFRIDQSQVTGATADLSSSRISISFRDPAAYISSVQPVVLTESPQNDGSLLPSMLTITIAYGVLAPDAANYVTASNLPDGLTYTVLRLDDTRLTVTIGGKANAHSHADGVDDLTFIIPSGQVTGATGDLVTPPLRIDFDDPAPPTPINPVVDDANNTFGWTNVSGYDHPADYQYSLNSGKDWTTCEANPQPVGNHNYDAGMVQVRLKADPSAGRPAGAALASDLPFTVNPEAPGSPSHPVVDDINDTFGWTNVPDYDEAADYEFSVDGGQTWTECSSNPQYVGDGNYPTHAVQVRVRADAATGRPAGMALLSQSAFTVYTGTPQAPTNPQVDDINDTFSWDFVGFNQVADYEHSLDFGLTWQACTANPQPVPAAHFPAGAVQVRVMAKNQHPAGAALVSTESFYGPPAFMSGYPAISAASESGFDLDIRLDEAGTAYYQVCDQGDPVPTTAELQASGTELAMGVEFAGHQLIQPFGIAVDDDCNVYVSLHNGDGTGKIKKYASNGVFLAEWGTAGSGDGQFSEPGGLAVDLDGNLWVVDTGNHRLQKFDPDGNFLGWLGKSDSSTGWHAPGSGETGKAGSASGQFNRPRGVAIDSNGDIFVTDSLNARVQRFDSAGIFEKAWTSWEVSGDGWSIGLPAGIAIDSQDNVYVVATSSRRILVFKNNGTSLREWSAGGAAAEPYFLAVEPDGDVLVPYYNSSFVVQYENDGTTSIAWAGTGSGSGQVRTPYGIAVDGDGNVYIADCGNGRIQKFDQSHNFVTQWGLWVNSDGAPGDPSGTAVDGNGLVYIAYPNSNAVDKFDPDGKFLLRVGSFGSGDGQLNHPQDVAVDGAGNIYVADSGNHRIQKFGPDGGFLAQWGSQGSGDGQVIDPSGVAVDSVGNVYVADSGNHRIQKFGSDGTFLIAWGSAGSEHGQFDNPRDLAVDSAGNVYVVDSGNDRIQVFDRDGNIIGSWGSDGSGDGQFSAPQGIAVDKDGAIFVADSGNRRVQVFDNLGEFITKWGVGGSGPQRFMQPAGIAVSDEGYIYVTDAANSSVQQFVFERTEKVSGLTSGWSYDVYVVAEDTHGNLQAEPTKLSVTLGVPVARIISTLPQSLQEAAPGNDGTVSGVILVTIADGSFATDISKADVMPTHLPPGLDYSVQRESATRLAISISGNAVNHANANDVSDLTFTIAQAAVSGAEGDLTTSNISIDFIDPDITPPVVATGSISMSNLTADGVTLSWRQAADDVSAAATLQYLVYWSPENNIRTVGEMESNGTAVGAFATDITSQRIDGLTADTTYYFNVMVKDEAGNQSAYTMQAVETEPAPVPVSGGRAGVTIIVHGWNLDNHEPSWAAAMQTDIIARTLKGAGHAAKITVTGSSGQLAFTCSPWDLDLATSSNGQVVVRVDWSAVANNLTSGVTAQEVAETILPALLQSQHGEPALAELPIHLIGHSRGGGLVYDLATLLGECGVEVEQVTSLDPHPLTSLDPGNTIDTPISGVPENVLFADNYWQNKSYPKGQEVAGAYNRGWEDGLPGGYHVNVLYSGYADHLNVYLMYDGTIDQSMTVYDGLASMGAAERDSWFASAEDGGTQAGFYYSSIGGGDRQSSVAPVAGGDRIVDGYHDDLGGQGERQSLNWGVDTVWPNLITLDVLRGDTPLDGGVETVTPGETLKLSYAYRDYDSACTVTFYADRDCNPYNGSLGVIAATQQLNATGSTITVAETDWTVTVLSPDVDYYLYAAITDGDQTRYLYALPLIDEQAVAPAASITSTQPTELTEADSNDGSLVSGTVVISIANGTLADSLVKADVTANNLPDGLDYTVSRDSVTQLTITISGWAAEHESSDSVSNLTFTIAQAKVAGATSPLTTGNISIDFHDAQQIVLGKPAKPVLAGKQATWTAVANENAGYGVQLYRDGAPIGSVSIAHGAALSCDFTSSLTEAGSYTVRVIALGTGTYSDSPQSDHSDPQMVVATGGMSGQAQLGEGTTNLELGNDSTLDLVAGVQTADDNHQIIIGGQSQDLGSYTGGQLNNVNLVESQDVGGQTVQVQQAVRLESGTEGEAVTITNANDHSISVSIPDGTTVIAPAGWDGALIPPRPTTGSGIAPAGFAVGDTVIEVGSPNGILLFDRPVILELKGVTGPVGYKPAGSDIWVQITAAAGGTYDNPVAPAFPGEAYVSNGTDTKIITWHFTIFAALVDTYSVTYAANGGAGDAPSEADKAAGVTFVAAENTFTAQSGKQFKEWNTATDGSGASYAEGAPVTMPAHNLVLYAIWEDIPVVTYTVTYAANGGTGDAPSEADKGAGVTFTAAENTFTAPEGKQFRQWNTEADGTGTAYVAGAPVTMPAHNLVLYASWEDIPVTTYSVTYDANGGTGTAPTESAKAEGASFAAAVNTFTAPEGKQFKQWNTELDGTGTSYLAGATMTMPGHDLTLYAIWEDIPVTTYSVTYDANGGTGTAPTESAKAEGATFTAAVNTFTAPEGKQFKQWNTELDGTGTSYLAGATVTMPGHDLTLYAIWEDIPVTTYSVTYDANGGTGTAPTESAKAEGATFTAAVNTFTAPEGKQFKQWNTELDGTGTSYLAGATVTMPGHDLTLYAIWEDIPVITYSVTYAANGGTGDAPTEDNKAVDATFAAAENTFIAPSGKQFKQWNTEADGTGTAYAEHATVTMPGHDLVLYATWEDIPAVTTYSVTYDANGGTGTAPTESAKAEGANFAAATSTFTAPEGKQFKQWNAESDGTGTSYLAGATVTMPGHGLTLYAIWEDIPVITYSVTYVANGGTGTAPSESDKAAGATFIAAANTFTAPEDKQFKQWNTAADGSGTAYDEQTTVTMPGHDLILYAIWEDIPIVTYSVTYAANGGTGDAPTESAKAEGASFAAATNTFTAPEGKQFKQWNTEADGTGTACAAGATVTMPGHDLTLYAVWEDIPVDSATISPTTGSFDRYAPSAVATSITWNDATAVADLQAHDSSIGLDNYSVDGTVLTITRGFLASQPLGNLLLTVEFDRGNAVTFRIRIKDTTPDEPEDPTPAEPPAPVHEPEIAPEELLQTASTEDSEAAQTVTTSIAVSDSLLEAAVRGARAQGQPVTLTLPEVEQPNDPETTDDGRPITRQARLTVTDRQLDSLAGTGLAVAGPRGTQIGLPQALLAALAAANTGLEMEIASVPPAVAQADLNAWDEVLQAQEINTNFSGATTLRFLAPSGIDPAELSLRVTHSDGTVEEITPTAVIGADGRAYLQIAVDRFSRFVLYRPGEEPPVTPEPKIEIVLTIGESLALVNGQEQWIDAAPLIAPGGGRTLVPVRFISEQLGAVVSWVPETRRVHIVDRADIWLTIDATEASVDGQRVPIDAPARTMHDRTYVPLRFISEVLGATVQYDPVSKSITIKR